MKTTKRIGLILTSFVLASAVLMTSCKKKETDDPDKDTSAASDNNTAEWVMSDVSAMAGQASESGSVSYRESNPNSVLASCGTVITSTATPQTFTVSFSGGMCNDGHQRSGSLIFNFAGSTGGALYYRHPGFNCVVSSSNYVVDLHQVSITHTVTNTTAAGFNPATTNMTWNIGGDVTIVKPSNGGTITWHCTRTQTLMNTSAITYNGNAVAASYVDQNTVINWATAVVSVSGTANGLTAKGESYSFTTTSPLVVNMNCTPNANKPGRHPIVQGSFEFTPANKGKRVVDFGNGSCDFLCEITVYTVKGTKYGPIQYQFDN